VPVNLSTLRTELLTDPRGLGYSAGISIGDHNRISDLLNTSAASHSVSTGTVYSLGMQQSVVPAEYAILSAAQRDLWGAIVATAIDGIAISNTLIRSQVAFIWALGTVTRTNLLALDTRIGSRAEVLFGEGTVVFSTEVGKALE